MNDGSDRPGTKGEATGRMDAGSGELLSEWTSLNPREEAMPSMLPTPYDRGSDSISGNERLILDVSLELSLEDKGSNNPPW